MFELLSLKLRAGSYFWFCKQRRRLEDVSGCLLDLVYLRKYSLSWYERVCSFLVDSAELCVFLCDLLQKDDGDVSWWRLITFWEKRDDSVEGEGGCEWTPPLIDNWTFSCSSLSMDHTSVNQCLVAGHQMPKYKRFVVGCNICCNICDTVQVEGDGPELKLLLIKAAK